MKGYLISAPKSPCELKLGETSQEGHNFVNFPHVYRYVQNHLITCCIEISFFFLIPYLQFMYLLCCVCWYGLAWSDLQINRTFDEENISLLWLYGFFFIYIATNQMQLWIFLWNYYSQNGAAIRKCDLFSKLNNKIMQHAVWQHQSLYN